MSTTGHTQAPRTAWINAMRSEVLRVGKRIPEVARVVHVGVWIATYADADGGNAFPGRDTLACLAGCSQESVTRCVKVLIGVGALKRRRRPNASSVYELVPEVFLPGGLPWEDHMHHYTDTRQRKAHAKKKAEEAAEAAEAARIASMDAVRTASMTGVPDRGKLARTASMDAPGKRPWTRSGQRPRRGSTKTPLPPVETPTETKTGLATHLSHRSARERTSRRPATARAGAASCCPTGTGVVPASAKKLRPPSRNGRPARTLRSRFRARSCSRWPVGARRPPVHAVSGSSGLWRTRPPRRGCAAADASTGCPTATAAPPASLPPNRNGVTSGR